ncbi:fungal-specific transcription factor domain-domain-containing protein [Leucosporidium creatinivorum]|uniref:Fungal-specific transcription factor domain-domain-containing protein n=1 Tax=Leucosporidium creatinivorum TaxID=106004 RepID=A0A1Y2DPH1_9BASI|nr:fungal-specific transcription factor domain-domain-containing protein [Leucosporidium creatinivorum]
MGGSPATSASALLGGGGGTPGDGGAGEGEGRTPDQGGGEGKGKVKEEEERDERWPTHFDPTREDRSPLSRSPSPPPAPAPAPAPAPLPPSPAVPSSSTATAEPSVPELTEPFAGSEKWKDVCWVDENVRGRVERVCELARFMPGGGERPFHFPQSLHTINHFLSNYFEYVLPLFPVVHLPTFSPPTSAPIVLAAQTCIGASFSPLPSAHKFSLDLAEQIRRALAALYEHDLRNLRSEEIMHAGLLTCVSGLWSGNKRAFELAEIARGQLVNLCRRGRLFDRPAIGRADGLGWTAWAAVESRKRLGACIMLLDGFFPSLLHTPSYISQGELSNMVFPCDERYWQATSAQQWQAMLGMAPIPPSPFFASCISTILTPRYVLHAPLPDPHLNPFGCLIIMTSLQHHIYELSQQLYTYMTAGITVPMYAGVPAYSETAPKPVNMALGFEGRKQWLKDALQLWRKHYAKEVQDPYMLWGQSLLWKGHMSLHVDVQDLNDAAGQHGAKAANAALGRLTKWAHSEDAVEASASAIQLLALLSTPSDLSSSHIGPYAPLCCFAATLTIWARLALGEKNSWDTQLAGRLVNMLGGVSLSSEEAPMAARRFGAGLLRKMKAWRIAESLESILLRIQ